ncbi:histone-lysine N-methyltransferase ATXR5-like protein [Trifolium pratense]|uniref:Histone-lysine N-methyltransferase ATXR5-like protein n=1 Tax=Trifolium pratense TaxID=57577 RepID=A0A2K3JVK2_TRIPR|nr:histone-lysine N-methyltransferase ATXR5-like protein [Trifolium pratense]
MASATSSPSSQNLISFIHQAHAPHYLKKSLWLKKDKLMDDIMVRVRYTVVEKNDYINIMCEKCGSSDQQKELMLCDKCDNGFHMKCVLRLVARPALLTMMLTSTTAYLAIAIISVIDLYFFIRTDFFKWCGMKPMRSPEPSN